MTDEVERRHDDPREPTAAERLLRRLGVSFSRGGWTRAHGMDEDTARKVGVELAGLYYQVRHVGQAKGGKWEVVFR